MNGKEERFKKNKAKSFGMQARACAVYADNLRHKDARDLAIKTGMADDWGDFDEKVRSVEDGDVFGGRN